MLFYNSLAFLKLYPPKTKAKITGKPKHVLDRWILARLMETIEKTTAHLNHYEIREGALAVEGLSDDLSRWFIRRSRSRFQPDRVIGSAKEKAEAKRDHEAVYAMLSFVLRETAKLTAPFTPFFAEGVYAEIKGSEKAASVHLADWPKVKKNFMDQKLIQEMAEMRKVASEGLAKRAEAGIKVRQPLQALWVKRQGSWMKNKVLVQVLKEEVNVKDVKVSPKSATAIELDIKLTPELVEEGTIRELMRSIQDLRQKATLKPKEQMVLMLEFPLALRDTIQKNEKMLMASVFAHSIEYKKSEKIDAEAETKIGEASVWLGIRKK
jgi:isoleucyl-tRNA synthetase